MNYFELLNKMLEEEKDTGKKLTLTTEEALREFENLEEQKLNSAGLTRENINRQASEIREKLGVIKRLVNNFEQTILDKISSASDLNVRKKLEIERGFRIALKETINDCLKSTLNNVLCSVIQNVYDGEKGIDKKTRKEVDDWGKKLGTIGEVYTNQKN